MSTDNSSTTSTGSTDNEKFLGVVGHELKTPATALKTYIQLLRRMVSRGASLAEIDAALQEAELQTDRLIHLTSDLMSFAETGRFSPVLAPCYLTRLLGEAVRAQRVLTPERE